uniref:2-phospho-L-lactate transferase CofD family protein n=1 Tax=Janibacter limosus TaxID=53458 RepID=A0AC61U231_9MICO|nr:2-phospho-L-lactate transferase CofD family protein [Janibacter limosus]
MAARPRRSPATRFIVAGMDRATAAPGVLDALREADVVVLAPADPVLSIGIVLGVAGVRDALRGTSAPIVGVTPDLADLGPSLAAVDVERTADGVASLYRDLRITRLPADASPADVLAITGTG